MSRKYVKFFIIFTDNETMEAKEFWEKLNGYIKNTGLSQRSFSEKCGFAARRIESLYSGNRFPDPNECVDIARVLGISVDYLLTGKIAEDITLSSDESVLLSAYRKTPKAYKRMALKLVIELTKADDPGDDFLYFDVSSDSEDKTDYNNEPPFDKV